MYCTDAVEGWDERISTVSGREDAMGGLWRGGPADRLSCATVSFFDHPVSLFAAWHGPSQTTAFPLSLHTFHYRLRAHNLETCSRNTLAPTERYAPWMAASNTTHSMAIMAVSTPGAILISYCPRQFHGT